MRKTFSSATNLLLKDMNDKAINFDLGLLLIRLALAVVFIQSGISKLSNIDGTTSFFAGLGLGAFFVYLVALVETLGGLALLLGTWTKYAGILLTIDMLFAIILVKGALGFTGAGYRLELVLLLSTLAIVFSGAGKYALMNWLGKSTMAEKEATR